MPIGQFQAMGQCKWRRWPIYAQYGQGGQQRDRQDGAGVSWSVKAIDHVGNSVGNFWEIFQIGLPTVSF